MTRTMEKTIDFTQSHAVITMNVTGESIRKKGKKCKTMSRKLREELAILIGAETSTIEIIKPTYIKRGLEIKIHVLLNDKDTQRIDYEKILIEATETNELAEIIRSSWKLSDKPLISNVKSIIVESKQQRIHSTATKTNDIEMLEQQMPTKPGENTNGETL